MRQTRARFQTEEEQRSVALRPDAVARAREVVAECGGDPALALSRAEAYLRMFPETLGVGLSDDGSEVVARTRGTEYRFRVKRRAG